MFYFILLFFVRIANVIQRMSVAQMRWSKQRNFSMNMCFPGPCVRHIHDIHSCQHHMRILTTYTFILHISRAHRMSPHQTAFVVPGFFGCSQNATWPQNGTARAGIPTASWQQDRLLEKLDAYKKCVPLQIGFVVISNRFMMPFKLLASNLFGMVRLELFASRIVTITLTQEMHST